MRTNTAKILFSAFAMAAGLCNLAHAEVRGEASRPLESPSRTGARDAFTDGARSAYTDGARGGSAGARLLPVVAHQGMAVCAIRGFDADTDGARMGERDPHTDGARATGRAGARDSFTDGARTGPRDTFSDGYRAVQSGAHGGGTCLSGVTWQGGTGGASHA
jgi:hypothetical protein